MNNELLTLLPLRNDIKNKYDCLIRAHDLNAPDNVIIAIRRKFYSAQDKLLEEAVKLKVKCPDSWYQGK